MVTVTKMRQVYFPFLVVLTYLAWGTQGYIQLEAEHGTLDGVSVGTSIWGYSGSGYVTGFDQDGDKVTLHFELPYTGSSPLYDLKIKYNSPFGNKGIDLNINGYGTSGMLAANGNLFTDASMGKFLLKQGWNTVVLGKGWGHFSIDFIAFIPVRQVHFDISPHPVYPHASPEARHLYSQLLSQFGHKVISGQHVTFDELEYVRDTSGGREPVVLGFDFLFTLYFLDHEEQARYMQKAIDWVKHKGGIAIFCWHWRNPFGIPHNWDTLGFYTGGKDNVHIDLNKIWDWQSDEYRAIMRDIDHVAIYLKQARDAGVPILFRPLHEAQGRWFWWGE